MIQLIGVFLLLFSTVMMIAAETTENYMWLAIGGVAYVTGIVECFISPLESLQEEVFSDEDQS